MSVMTVGVPIEIWTSTFYTFMPHYFL